MHPKAAAASRRCSPRRPIATTTTRCRPGPQFLWRETGPIDFYVKQGYAYVHMDVRGSGKSGGEFEFLGPNEQKRSLRRHPVDRRAAVVQRQGRRPRPVVLLHVAVVDGHHEAAGARLPRRLRRPQRSLSRLLLPGRHPGTVHPGLLVEPEPHHQPLPGERRRAALAGNRPRRAGHLASDLRRFLERRAARPSACSEITVPLYSIGIWGKTDLHTRGNIKGFQPRQRPAQAADARPAQRVGGERRVQRRRAAREGAAALLRPLPEGQGHRVGQARAGRVLRARRQRLPHRRHMAAAWRAVQELAPERRQERQRHFAQRWLAWRASRRAGRKARRTPIRIPAGSAAWSASGRRARRISIPRGAC